MSEGSILISGASSGIGAALAKHYAAPGVTLVLSGRNGERLEAVAEQCRKRGAIVRAKILDIRDAKAALDWIAVEDAAHPIGLAILNAGLAGTRIDARQGERPADMLAQVETNLGGTLVMAQAIGALMVGRGTGHLALMSSLNGLFPVVEAPTYSATKAGILAYADAIRDWLEPAGVFVTTIRPGFVASAIAQRYSGPRPFEMSAEAAAQRIGAGLIKHRRQISFPAPLVAAITLGKLVPRGLRRRILAAYSAQLAPLSPDDTTRPNTKS